MKQILLIAAILATAIGCTSKPTKAAAPTVKRDSLLIDNKTYYLDSIGEFDFGDVLDFTVDYPDDETIDDTTNVTRDSINLVFKLRNGEQLVLANDTAENSDGFVVYNYLESYNQIDYWLIRTYYYEGGSYLLLNKNNGEKTWVWGPPIVSPDKKRAICCSIDLEAQFEPNGFQLLTIDNRKVTQTINVDLTHWGPSDVRWKDRNTIYFEQTRTDYKNPDNVSYKRMSLN
jgi:hypothetical protein